MTVQIATVEKVETVTGDFYTEPGEPFWRVVVGEYVADFDYEEAARNFAGAVNEGEMGTLRYCERQWQDERATMLDMIAELRAEREALRAQAINRGWNWNLAQAYGREEYEAMLAREVDETLRNQLAPPGAHPV